ncbi:4690_t:CDS:2 [Ambispora gerdemannii]|uniref:4690_t:CDS:1 n=1 Tax=Ambispora gerdemannii TaxID=144530 RepID=A0A9N8YRQ8_9GLOM|nr:4690_t:CDS:2 [Ambispora gerdemannii]
MAPRYDRKPVLVGTPTNKTKIGSSSATGYSPFADSRALELILNNVQGEIVGKNISKKQHSLVAKNKRKVAFNLKHTVFKKKASSPLSQQGEFMTQEHEAKMWKYKRIEVQAQVRKAKRALHEQKEKIHKKRQELKRLKIIESELRQILDKCESQSQELSVTSASLVFRVRVFFSW